MQPNIYIRELIISYCNNKTLIKIICTSKSILEDYTQLNIFKFKKYLFSDSKESLEWKSKFDEKRVNDIIYNIVF